MLQSMPLAAERYRRHQMGYVEQMKVILTEDVLKLGDAGTIQTVKDGYARNYLIPQGLAVMATPGMVKQVEERQRAIAKRVAKLEDELRGLAERIDGLRVEIEARVGEQGRLYGSVTAADVAVRLQELLGEEIDRRKVDLEQPIREVGEYKIPVRLVGRLAPEAIVVVFDPDQPLVAAVEEVEAGEDDVADELDELDELAFDSDEE
jgi:large subunit ribosomal protein L9